MIDDLFTELAIGAVDGLLSGQKLRDDADFGMARLNDRLSMQVSDGAPLGLLPPFDLGLEARLLNNYLHLGVADLEQILPGVHEWLLERLSKGSRLFIPEVFATLGTLYFLFPETTLRHVIVGLLVQADSENVDRDNLAGRQRLPINVISEAIDSDKGIAVEDRADQIRILANLLVDFLDVFPEATGRALAMLHQGRREEFLTAHLNAWSNRLGGELKTLIRRIIDHPNMRE